MRKLTLILVTIIIVLICSGLLLILNWTEDIPDEVGRTAEFSATSMDQAGVDVSSTFRFGFSEKTSSASVHQALTIDPEVTFAVHQGNSSTEILVVPTEPLVEDTIYTFTLNCETEEYTWAVQTEKPLEILGSIPGDPEMDVATSTPLQIVLNHACTIDLEALGESISITPETAFTCVQKGRQLTIIPTEGWQPGTCYQVNISAGLPLTHSTKTTTKDYSFSFETASSQFGGFSIAGESVYSTGQSLSFVVEGELSEDAFCSLYSFDGVDTYGQVLCGLYEKFPAWSNGRKYYGNTLPGNVFQSDVAFQHTAQGIRLSQTLPEGYYALCVTDGDYLRTVYFCVSDLAVFSANDSENTLFWVCQSGSNTMLSNVSAKDLVTDSSATGDVNGLIHMTEVNGGVFLLQTETDAVVIPIDSAEATQWKTTWQYLYTDKSVYQNGDTLYYAGYLANRDQTPLEYERVSVYLQQIGEFGNTVEVYREYADLSSGCYWGDIVLPNLLPGEYELQIWQSGKQYSCQKICIAEDEIPPDRGDGNPTVYANATKYLVMNAEYQINGAMNGMPTLFLLEDQGLRNAPVLIGDAYTGIFSPMDGLDQYVYSVQWTGTQFTAGQTTLLAKEIGDTLQLTISGDEVLAEKQENAFSVMVTDENGVPVPNASVVVQVYGAESMWAVNNANLFTDYSLSGLSVIKQQQASEKSRSGNTFFYTLVQTNEEGMANFQVPTPIGTEGQLYLLLQAFASGEENVCTGMTQIQLYGVESVSDVFVDEEEERQEKQYQYTVTPFTAGNTLSTAEELVIFTDKQRSQYLSILLDCAFAQPGPEDSAAIGYGVEHARQLLSDYQSEAFSDLFDGDSAFTVAPQMADGGFGDLRSSVIIAAYAPANVSYFALEQYFNAYLNHGATGMVQAMALAGAASCGGSVLDEIQSLLMYTNPDDDTFLWLIWGLIRSGDQQGALSYYLARTMDMDFHPTDTGLYAVVNAYLGFPEEALLLLSQTTDNLCAGVLVVRALLAGTYQEERSFSYEINGVVEEGSLVDNSDFVLMRESLSTGVTLVSADHGVYCVMIEEKENGEVENTL